RSEFVRGLRRPAGRGFPSPAVPHRFRSRLRTRVALFSAIVAACLQLTSARAAEPDDTAAAYSASVQRVARILEQIKARYVRPIDDQRLIAGALSGVLKGLDPYSAYLDKEAFREMQRDARGEYGGIGIESRMERDFMEITSVLESTPAQRAG